MLFLRCGASRLAARVRASPSPCLCVAWASGGAYAAAVVVDFERSTWNADERVGAGAASGGRVPCIRTCLPYLAYVLPSAPEPNVNWMTERFEVLPREAKQDLLTLGLYTQRAAYREAAQNGDNRIWLVVERIPSRSLDSLPASEVHPKYAVISPPNSLIATRTIDLCDPRPDTAATSGPSFCFDIVSQDANLCRPRIFLLAYFSPSRLT